MVKNRASIGVLFFLIGIIILDALIWWPMSPDREMEFKTSVGKGIISGNGMYTFYSKGKEITEKLIPEQDNGAKLYSIEFPLLTKDGKSVQAMYYFYGNIHDGAMLYRAFRYDFINRWILTVYIPHIVRSALQNEVKNLPEEVFHTQESNEMIKENVWKQIAPFMQAANINPIILSVTVYPSQ